MKRIILGATLAVYALASMAAGLTAKEIEGLRSAMDARLKDSQSARFKDVRVGDKGTTCGLVNAKNSYGAFAGYVPFMAVRLSTGDFYVVDISEEAGQICQKKGI